MKTKNYFSHETAIIDDGCKIGEKTKIWHFSHIMTKCELGEKCNIGQNVVISPNVVLGNNVKVQNNVSIYEGVICEDDVFLGPSMVFTNIKSVGNTVSASIPIALKYAMSAGKIKEGDRVLCSGFGVGLSWSTCIIQY